MKSNCLLLLGAFFVTLPRSEAVVVPVRTATDLAKAADVVVLGEVVSTRQVGVALVDIGTEKVPSQVMAAELRVQEVLKGPQGISGLTVRFLLPDRPIGYGTPPVGTSAIFFLNQAGQEYTFTSPHHPSVVGLPGAAPEGATLSDRIVSCVEAVIESAETSLEQKRRAISVLWLIPDARSMEALQRASHSSEPSIRLGAVAYLLMRNDISGLQLAAEALLHARGGPFSPGIKEGLVAGIGLVKDPRAVPTLGTLLERGDDAVRRAAARALANTSSPDATDPLARALYDPDQQVRFWAVLGLADITGQKNWRPTADTFRDREAEYLSHWRVWATGR